MTQDASLTLRASLGGYADGIPGTIDLRVRDVTLSLTPSAAEELAVLMLEMVETIEEMTTGAVTAWRQKDTGVN